MSTVVPNAALVPPGVTGAPRAPASPGGSSSAALPGNGQSFADVLAQSAGSPEPPRFSRHALDRLQQRGIEVGGQTLSRLTGGVARAAGKGSRDSVVFVDGTAFVVSVKNNTVITAVGSEHMREQVFTNIDSAVIA
jgi:flagellar operon protein